LIKENEVNEGMSALGASRQAAISEARTKLMKTNVFRTIGQRQLKVTGDD
jgi:hypothetical protein